KSKEEKMFLINQMLEKFRGTFFRQAMFAEFEWKTHQMCWEGTPLTKDVLCSLYHDLNVKYFGEDMVVDSDIDYEWERIPHFYRPFYVYQYSTGFAAATAVAGKILAGDTQALEGYFKFLKGGCSMTPIELLKLCGLDMEKPNVVNEALDVFEAHLDELEDCK
ncbi:MAG: oligoendopeptidase F, partial [Lachnospiraceae bacterium]|nr:oligoendopeptidase F [Lachnospiraceae bacterium]